MIEEGFSREKGGGSLLERRGAWRSWVGGRGELIRSGVHQWDLDQKLMGGDWEQELRGRVENQEEGLGGLAV
jgi:hypothetical protein